jgi:hypothetical protein
VLNILSNARPVPSLGVVLSAHPTRHLASHFRCSARLSRGPVAAAEYAFDRGRRAANSYSLAIRMASRPIASKVGIERDDKFVLMPFQSCTEFLDEVYALIHFPHHFTSVGASTITNPR